MLIETLRETRTPRKDRATSDSTPCVFGDTLHGPTEPETSSLSVERPVKPHKHLWRPLAPSTRVFQSIAHLLMTPNPGHEKQPAENRKFRELLTIFLLAYQPPSHHRLTSSKHSKVNSTRVHGQGAMRRVQELSVLANALDGVVERVQTTEGKSSCCKANNRSRISRFRRDGYANRARNSILRGPVPDTKVTRASPLGYVSPWYHPSIANRQEISGR